MKKFLKFLLILIVVVVGGLLIAGLIMPTTVFVSRTTLIKGSKEAVFEQMVKFTNWEAWSPWLALDTNAVLTYEGTDGTVGSSYTWDSQNGDVGKGKTTNTGIDGTAMNFHIDFMRPFENVADGTISAADSAGMVRANWRLNIRCPFPFNALQLFPFLSMEKMVGKAFEQGLAKMKVIVESNPTPTVETPRVEITEADYPAHVFAGIRKTVGWSDIGPFFGESMGILGKNVGEKINGAAVGLYYTWDTVNKQTDMVAAFPVSDTIKGLKGVSFIRQEASKALMAVHKGPYTNMKDTHMALGKEVAARGKMQVLVVEEYITGMHEQPDSTQWVTNIYYLVK